MTSPAPRNALLVAAICLISFHIWAQRSAPRSVGRTSIRGSVRDAVTHRALERVVVMAEAPDSGYSGQTETDPSGKFDFEGLAGGVYNVRIRISGYQEAVQQVDLTVVADNYLSFELRPLPRPKAPAVAPEGPGASLDARLAAVPEKARKEFSAARELWQKGKDPQASIDHLKKAIKFYPQFSDAYVMLGTLYVQQNNPAEAKSALHEAIEINPKLPEARLTLGSLQNYERDYSGAEISLLEGLKLDEQSAQGHYELAKTYWALGRWLEAEPHALKAAALQPSMAPVHVILGNIALRKNDAAGALKEFQEYLKLDPKGPMAEASRAIVKRIQDALDSSR